MSSPAAAPLPVGFRFRPTDEELVRHYLKPKIAGLPHPDLLLIPDVDLSACEPWDLPAKALIKSDDPEWFFFAPLDRKYPGGHRSNRSTAAGYWKATGKDRLIRSRPAGNLIGIKKTLVFHRGRAPRGQRTAWIMHEYRTTEPHLQQGQHGSFVLYRLFNKHEEEEEAPVGPSNLDEADSPSTSSAPAISTVVKPAKLPRRLLVANDDDPAAPQANDPLLDVLAHLPDLQPVQAYDDFPIISSPMRPYTDHPFLGNLGGQDLSAYIDSIIAHQDLEDPSLAKPDEQTAEDAKPNAPIPLMLPSNSSNYKGVDDTGAAHCSSGTKTLQKDAGDVNHDTGAQNNLAYHASAQGSHLYSQSQLHSNSPEMEPPNSATLFSARSWTPYPQQLFKDVVEPSGSDLTNSDAFNGLEDWAAEPTMMQQFPVPNLPDPQQGTAARRIRLVHSVQRASVTETVLTSHLESEDEAGSCYSIDNSSTNNNKDHANLISETMAGEATHIQDGGLQPTQVVPSMEVTEKSRDFPFDEHISSHPNMVHEANLKQRVKQEHTKTSQNVSEGLQHGGRVPGEPSYRKTRQSAPVGSVVRFLCLALVVILALVGLWKSSLCKPLH
ncbi:hypothetical protein EJB05_55332 [Eragrostis curvula]|uniref:NAC domain-containing protein n=1 Tax=Eragrostis curvula TaxID=38414 RepID=A0A5J9SKC7_9POAL|nr:hypothetical protein EJB05_55332 [Eragrostis curvula]